ncbi:unnamed protein product [Diamesa hyperborea]
MMKKHDDNKMLKTLREIVSIGGNKQCFDCGQKGVTYVNMTIGSFVCTTCSGILRGLTPPHRVKSISMATFLADEVDFVRCHGNDECAKTWLGLWDSKRVIKQDHREFMVDKYERKRYYLEPASPLKSITTSLANNQQSQHQPLSSSTSNLTSKIIQTPADNLAALKAITLTPPTSNNRQHRTHHLHNNNNGSLTNNNHHNTTNTNTLSDNQMNNNFTNGDDGFVADFGAAKVYNNSKMTNGNGVDPFANFADFENNKIYNAAGLPMSTSSLSNNSLNSSGGTFNSNSSLNSTPSVDRYAALKDLDEQFRDQQLQQLQQQQQQQQNYQNWTIPEQTQNNNNNFMTNGFGSPLQNNGFTNGFYYNSNMTNGNIMQASPFGVTKAAFGNPFMAGGGTANSNNPFL